MADISPSSPPPARRFHFWRWFWLSLLGLYVILQALSLSNFCYDDRTWYSKRELLDLYLFGREGLTMTEAEKVARLKKEKGGVYPDCCWVTSGTWRIAGEIDFLSEIIIRRFWHVDTYFPDFPRFRDFYPWHVANIDACGRQGGGTSGSSEDANTYYRMLEDHHRSWSKEK